MMRCKVFLTGLLALVAACGTIETETRGEITVYGQTYETVTRQFVQNGQTVTTGAVIYNKRTYGCNTLLPGDCEYRVELLDNDDTLARNVLDTPSSAYVITDPNTPEVKPLNIKLW